MDRKTLRQRWEGLGVTPGPPRVPLLGQCMTLGLQSTLPAHLDLEQVSEQALRHGCSPGFFLMNGWTLCVPRLFLPTTPLPMATHLLLMHLLQWELTTCIRHNWGLKKSVCSQAWRLEAPGQCRQEPLSRPLVAPVVTREVPWKPLSPGVSPPPQLSHTLPNPG